MAEITHICSEYEIDLDYVASARRLEHIASACARSVGARGHQSDVFSPSSYFRLKHLVDFSLSLLLIVVLLPIFLIIAVMVLLDVGSPIFFWQRRVGINGQGFHMHKFRTLKPAYDDQGRLLDNRSGIMDRRFVA